MKLYQVALAAVCCARLAEGWVSSVARPLRSPHAPRESFRRARVAVRAEGDEASHGERPISSEWELDCFSRPVLVKGKKLWELLITDASGQWRDVVALPATGVNSVAVRKAIEDVIARAPVKPTVIRFFRRQMLNMLTIALNGVAANRPTLRVTPSRATHALYDWIEEREADVYPGMEGYSPGAGAATRDRMTAPVTASRLPEGLRGEQYAFVTLPLSEVLSGGGITEENVGVGKLINVKPAYEVDALLPGIAILTRRSDALAMSLASTELAGVRADAAQRQLVLDVALDESFLVAKLDDDQRVEAAAFEKAKQGLGGLHFVVVQSPEDDGVEPAGFWLLRETQNA
ncbi:hypothetical protein AURANDRAFT_27892 [Aureococcus anophagefferens]|uniref:Uncharacterized protein n=1 Tax=Aureococcus anophagefferens TaxID=44056 RepID=F0YBK7_AURAN|nr:hypothetical protein AURANDRAFT_27892 [Aureococcus anophagefferens]EGB07385.1 hypothetical protein AURANDRAFT_27892 [Aureococcus anophagefferens]|eukprot:XP_009038004.1 hypothetical protein AURANDRAFT_27892 [Aureococcus anophagefferens]